jgi:hypothetical protein
LTIIITLVCIADQPESTSISEIPKKLKLFSTSQGDTRFGRMGNGPSNLTKIPINQTGSGMMSAADFGLSETVKLEHAFTFNIGEKWERPLRKATDSLSRMGYHWAESFRIIATGLSAYFVLAGLAKLVAATKSTDDHSRSKGRSSRSKTGYSKESGGDKSSSKTANLSSVTSEDESKGNEVDDS